MSSNVQSNEMLLKVSEVRLLSPMISLLRLTAEDTSVLPMYSAGAHIKIKVSLPGGQLDWREYSLVNFDMHIDATSTPIEYVIAVRLDDAGRGGSRWMHESIHAGDFLTVQAPRNDFPMSQTKGCAVLVAGGIGITPLSSMATQRRLEGSAVRLHYAGRSRESMAFLPELKMLLGDDLLVHVDTEQGGTLDIESLLDACSDTDQLYVCGPKVMLDAVIAHAIQRSWSPERIHFELFTAPALVMGDHAFEVVLAMSGKSITVAADQTLLDALIDANCDPMFDCKRGECGVCAVAVIEGEIEHRDYVLSALERTAGNIIQTCVSRCKGSRLVLDL